MASKYRTREQVETAHQRAVRFAESVQQDAELADELASLTTEEYADRKRLQIINPYTTERNRAIMPKQPTRAELQGRIEELEEENAAMAEQLDNIAQIVTPESDEDEEEEADDDGDEY